MKWACSRSRSRVVPTRSHRKRWLLVLILIALRELIHRRRINMLRSELSGLVEYTKTLNLKYALTRRGEVDVYWSLKDMIEGEKKSALKISN